MSAGTKHRRRIFAFIVAGALMATAGTAAFSVEGGQTAEQHRLDLESFDYVWKTVYEKHYDTNFGGVDWQAVRTKFRPTVEAAQTRTQARDAMQEMLARLGETHFCIFPSDLYEDLAATGRQSVIGGTTGLDVRVVDGRVLVVAVEPATAAAEAGIASGWEVLRVGERDLAPLMAAIAGYFGDRPRKGLALNSAAKDLLRGAPGETISVRVKNGAGETSEHALRLSEPAGTKFQMGHIPPIYIHFKSRRLEGNIGQISFNHFMAPGIIMPAFNEVVQSFMQVDGIIIDIRGNPGGQAELISGMAGWFVGEKNRDLGMLLTRDTTLRLVVRPRPEIYTGRLAILVDDLSTCASEIFASGLRELGRARILGAHTGGATLGSTLERLPNGDGFQYAFANFISAGGYRLEGNGVAPDVPVQHTQAVLLAGRDLMLEAAVEWIKGRR